MNKPATDRFRLTPRDREVLVEVFLSNCLTSRQAVGLGLFTGRSRANRRLKALADRGYLRRKPLPVGQSSSETAYFIGLNAVAVVAAHTGTDAEEVRRHACRPMGRTFIEHSVLVTTCRIRLMALAAGREVEWRSEAECRHEYSASGSDGIRRPHVLKADGAIVFGGEAPFVAFFEGDRNFVSPLHWERTVRGYSRYARLGLCLEAYGTASFAVLVVTEGGEGRVRRLSSIARQSPVPFHFATVTSLMADPDFWLGQAGGTRLSLQQIIGEGEE